MAIGPAVLDTNVLIHALSGTHPVAARTVEEARAHGLAISIITKIEVLTKVPPGQEEATDTLLKQCSVINLTPEIANLAVQLRKRYKLRTPDAIICATALAAERRLVTFNSKDFRVGMHSVYLAPIFHQWAGSRVSVW